MSLNGRYEILTLVNLITSIIQDVKRNKRNGTASQLLMSDRKTGDFPYSLDISDFMTYGPPQSSRLDYLLDDTFTDCIELDDLDKLQEGKRCESFTIIESVLGRSSTIS